MKHPHQDTPDRLLERLVTLLEPPVPPGDLVHRIQAGQRGHGRGWRIMAVGSLILMGASVLYLSSRPALGPGGRSGQGPRGAATVAQDSAPQVVIERLRVRGDPVIPTMSRPAGADALLVMAQPAGSTLWGMKKKE